MIVSAGRFSKPRLTRLRLFNLPSSSTIFTDLEPMSRPATLFFLPNIVFICSCTGASFRACSHPKMRVCSADFLPPGNYRKRRGIYSTDQLKECADPHFFGCLITRRDQ